MNAGAEIDHQRIAVHRKAEGDRIGAERALAPPSGATMGGAATVWMPIRPARAHTSDVVGLRPLIQMLLTPTKAKPCAWPAR